MDLQKQLEMYQNGNLDELEKIMISDEDHSVSDISHLDIDDVYDIEQQKYPVLTKEKKKEIKDKIKIWTKIMEKMDNVNTIRKKIDKKRNEIMKDKLDLESSILSDMETYGLKDIERGPYKLIPKVKKGLKPPLNKKTLLCNLKEYANNNIEGIDDPNEFANQIINHIEDDRKKKKKTDQIVLSYSKMT